ncbi:MAG: hypothetical protein WAL41_13225 [Mycobacterium sp.]
MGRHRLASDQRKSPVAVAVVAAPVAIIFALGGSAHQLSPVSNAASVADGFGPGSLQVTTAAPGTASWTQSTLNSDPSETAAASRGSRWRVVAKDAPRLLVADIAPERGLQVKTILAARSVTAAFPEIKSIGGFRPDALPWHPRGLAIDIMIPNPSSAAGIALGNEIVRFAFKNADRFALQDVIWRGTYYTPSGPSGSGYGHYDHVHITTHGGGYPTGGEVYVR